MTNKSLVRKIYKTAYCSEFLLREELKRYRFIVRYCENNLRDTPIGWGDTQKAAWKDAAENIKDNMVEMLEQ